MTLFSRRGLLALAALAAVSLPGAQAQAASTTTEAQMLQLQDRFMAAYAGTDLDALANLISDKAVYIHPTGEVNNKQMLLDRMRSGPLPRFSEVKQKNTKVMVYPGVAVLTGDAVFARAGAPASTTFRLSTAYADEKGTWRLISWHMSAIGPVP